MKIYWSSSGTSVSPGEAIDAIKMTDRWYLWSQKISFHLFKFWNSCASKRKHAGQPWDGPMTRLPFTQSSALMRVNPMKPNDNDYIWLWRSEEEKATKVQFLHLDHDQCQGGDICDLTGIPALQPPNLQFIHWMVSNVPGDRVCTFGENHIFLFFFPICLNWNGVKVYAGDENYEYVPPFSFKLDSNNQLVSCCQDDDF